MQKKYYLLDHEYEELEGSEYNDFTKFIGVFSSAKKAKEAIEYLRSKPGFNNYPKKSFTYGEIKINQYEWKQGFISWKDALIDD